MTVEQKMRIDIALMLGVVLFFVLVMPVLAVDDPRRCSDYDLPSSHDGIIERTHPVFVVRENTPVYQTPTSSSPVEQLRFNTRLNLRRVMDETTRVEVTLAGSNSLLGWVEKSDLLCASHSMKSADTGLEKIFFIKIAVEMQDEEIKTVNAYPWPDRSDCPGSGCRQLSRFQRFFIFDYDQTYGRYLLANYPSLEGGESLELYGWVDEDDGFIWDTAYGLRPRDDLLFPDGHKNAGEPMSVPLYMTLDDARAGKNYIPILGGPIWYKYEMRMPLIGREGDYYKVILSAPGKGVRQISPDTIGVQEQSVESLQNLKKVDVFFLIDGTNTMEPYIEAVRGSEGHPGVVQNIIDTFSRDEQFKGTQFRFGYRIYRDTYAGEKNLGEGLPLSSTCNLTDNEKRKNRKNFEKLIKGVKASVDDHDDYEENLYGGISQAIDDIRPCPEHTKILFVIGDHGYNKTGVTAQDLIREMKGYRDDGSKSVVPFFIQTPNDPVNTSHAYDRAYELFQSQARQIIAGILPDHLKNEVDTYYLNTNDRNLPGHITTAVKRFVPQESLVNELILDLRGGMSLQAAIERMKGEYNMPILFWENALNGSCSRLGEQCYKRVYNVTMEGYIPISDNIVEDISVRADDLSQWIALLSRMDIIHSFSGTLQRKLLIDKLKEELEIVLGYSLEKCGKIGDCLSKRKGLPVNDQSPLFKYSVDQLMDPVAVPDCELVRIIKWMNDTRAMLTVVHKGQKKPVYDIVDFPGTCRTDNEIPYIDGEVDEEWLCPTQDCSYRYYIQRAAYYWVPKEYMP